MRCATCGHAWHAKLQEEEGEPAPVEETGLTREQVERLRQTAAENTKARAGPHAEFRAREHAKRKRHRGRAVTIAWAISGGIFVVAIGAAIIFRNEVAEAFPRVASIYRLVGLEVNRFGLTFENVEAKRTFDGTTPVLTVTGAVINGGEERLDTPQLRVTLKDESGKIVQTWTDNFATPSLGPSERTEFTSKFEAPPVETYRLTVSFVRPEDDGSLGDEAEIQASTEGGGAAPAHATSGAKPEGEHAEPGWGAGDGVDAHEVAGDGHATAPTPEPVTVKSGEPSDH